MSRIRKQFHLHTALACGQFGKAANSSLKLQGRHGQARSSCRILVFLRQPLRNHRRGSCSSWPNAGLDQCRSRLSLRHKTTKRSRIFQTLTREEDAALSGLVFPSACLVKRWLGDHSLAAITKRFWLHKTNSVTIVPPVLVGQVSCGLFS